MGDSGDFRNNVIVKRIVQGAKKIAKTILRLLMTIFLPIILVFVLLAASIYYIFVWVDGSEKEGDWSSPEYAAGQYTSNVSINDNGTVSPNISAQELWDKMEKSNNRASLYLSSPEELLKLMNAEMVTQYLDMRPNPDASIDWDKANNINNKEIQGIVKLKRADSNGNKSTMVYTDQETFQRYIDEYNSTGSETAKKNALTHFTLEKKSTLSGNQNVSRITAGTTINIPSGLGKMKTFEAWDYPKGNTSLHWSEGTLQRKLWDKADGLNSYDENGFGKVNGRYVIACTETFGQPGDYIDFYLENGEVMPCIIGDIKNQSDSGANKWGHENGQCIIEFMVKTDKWYNQGAGEVGDPTVLYNKSWHGQQVIKAVNGGSYFDNSNLGTENLQSNNTANNTGNEKDNETMKWPTDGTTITSNFGDTDGRSGGHKGLDIGVAQGTNVYACESGKVEIAGTSQTAGNWVVIDHGNGYKSKYMHNSVLKVSAGDNVEKGQLIALSGNTGQSTGPHLHFQLEYNGTPIDPLTLKYDNGQGNGNGGVGSNVDNANSSTSQYYAKVVTWNENTNTIESNDPEIEESKTTTYSMTPTIVNYVELTKGYTMPFDYLWALLVMSENKDFVLKLADLVYNSEIEITVHDNLEIDTNVVVDKYTKKERVDTDGMATVVSYTKADTSVKNTTRANEGQSETPKTNTVSKTGEWSDEESKSYVVTNTTVNKKNTINYKLTKANVWLENYTQEYTYQTPKTTTTTNTVKLEDENYGDSPDSTSNEDTYGHMKELFENLKKSVIAQNNNSQNISIDGQINYINTKVYHATVDKSKETTDTTETKQYVESPAKIQEKTDPKSKEPNFVTLYLENTNEKGRSNISSASSWLFEILENNTSTQDMVDLTKYLLYKATKKDYGVKEYDFSVYSPSELSDMDNGGQSNIEGVPGQIADFFLKKGMPIEGVAAILGNIEQECGFDASAISSPDYYGGYHGLCQWGNYQGSKDGRFAQLEKLAKKKGKDWKDVDVQIEFIWQELNGSGYKSVKDKLMNGKDVNQTTEFFAREYEKCINADGSIQQLDKRQNYANKWLKELKQKATGDSTNIDTSSFLSTAKSCHDYLRINQYWYPTSANLAAGRFVSDNGMPQTHKFPTRGEAVKDRYVDCSAYVSWVLKEYGYNISYPYTASMLNNNPLNLISVPISDVKAGDILVRSNHTEIYCGNGKAYSCGSTSAIREEYSNCNPSGFTNAYRVNKTK